MNKRFFEALSEDQQMAEIWEEIGAPGAGAVLPDQTGNGGKVLRTNGTDATWSFDGSTLTELDAAELIGIVPDASFPATLPAASGANLTNLDASDLTGSIAAARITVALTTAQPVAATTLTVTTINAVGVITAVNVIANNALGVGTCYFYSPSDGIVGIYPGAGSFDRFQFGGTTAGSPSLAKRSATLECRLADDSAIATLVGAMVLVAGAVTDAAFTNPVDGCHGYDSTNFKHYVRSGGTWRSSAVYS